jgi:hypothetical protein
MVSESTNRFDLVGNVILALVSTILLLFFGIPIITGVIHSSTALIWKIAVVSLFSFYLYVGAGASIEVALRLVRRWESSR